MQRTGKIRGNEAARQQDARPRGTRQQRTAGGTARIDDRRPNAVRQRSLVESIQNSAMTRGQAHLGGIGLASARTGPSPAGSSSRRKPNNTGVPDKLKLGVENLSGFSLDRVRVHYNSLMPTRVEADAFTQGTEIHLAPGQQKHLAHELWHVVQQMQGRVRATRQYKGRVAINDDTRLESEADVMGYKAQQSLHQAYSPGLLQDATLHEPVIQRQLSTRRLNVVGEYHPESDERRELEERYCQQITRGGYWRENEFRLRRGTSGLAADPGLLIVKQRLAFMQTWARNLLARREWNTFHTHLPNLYDNVHIHFLNMMHILPDAMTENYPRLRSDRQRARREAEYRGLVDAAISLDYHLGAATDLLPLPANGAGTIELINGHLDHAAVAYNYLDFNLDQDSDGVRQLRSEFMHQAARKNRRTKGVWKIGELHVRDIEDNHQEEVNYNLMRQEEFNELFSPTDELYQTPVQVQAGYLTG